MKNGRSLQALDPVGQAIQALNNVGAERVDQTAAIKALLGADFYRSQQPGLDGFLTECLVRRECRCLQRST